MRIPPALTLLPAIVLMAAGCAGAGTDTDTTGLADQADRVAQLLADDQPCAAAEALRELEALTDGDTRPEVRDAVTTFVASARASTRCEVDTGSPEPAPSQAPPDQPAPDPERGDGPDEPPKVPPGQEDDGQDDDNGEDDDKPGKGKGRDD